MASPLNILLSLDEAEDWPGSIGYTLVPIAAPPLFFFFESRDLRATR